MIWPMKFQVDEVIEAIERMERSAEQSRIDALREICREINQRRIDQLDRQSGCNDPE